MKALILKNHGRHQIGGLELEVKEIGFEYVDVIFEDKVFTISWDNISILAFYDEVDTMVDMDPDTKEKAIFTLCSKSMQVSRGFLSK